MDSSYNFYFERMSDMDLQSLSCQVSRLSPSKSTSSIDQFPHPHGKGDSAYSSFSGGSNAPGYYSPFLPDEISPHGLQYTDLKYVKAIYNPSVLRDSRSMDQLYQSVEAVSQQSHNNEQSLSRLYRNQEVPSPRPPPPPPPLPPARVDSFITIKNLENCRGNPGLEGQLAEKSDQKSPSANPDVVHPGSDPVHGCRVSQFNIGEPGCPYGSDQAYKQQRFADTSPSAFIQQKCLKKQDESDFGESENQRKRSRSVHVLNSNEQLCAGSNQHATQNTINGDIQHKGQYYFVTGVLKSTESSSNGAVSGLTESRRSTSEYPQRLTEKEQSPNAVDDVSRNVKHQYQSSYDAQRDVLLHLNKDTCSKGPDKELQSNSTCQRSFILKQGSHSFDSLEQKQTLPNREIGIGSRKHTSSSHHIFYCGPEDGVPSPSYNNKGTTPSIPSLDQVKIDKKADSTKGKRPSLGDVANEKINKETTPLLYRLTGESRGALSQKSKNERETHPNLGESRCSITTTEPQSNEDGVCRPEQTSSSCCSVQLTDTCKEDNLEPGKMPCYSGNTLDDSFKKYYKEKLKDAQSKVLRETSFKRKDLQLSWPHRVRQRPEPRPSILLSASSLRDSVVTSDSSMPSESEQEVLAIEKGKKNEECGKENGKPPNVPQPQVARVGGRKRLTPEQKKLCYSEPEKLHQLGATPAHTACSSLGNEREGLSSRDEEQGVVAFRKKVFESRGRAMSASSLSKTTLKQIQHKALAAYMERKTGYKTAEPQQPVPLAPSQRHSTAGQPSDWVLRPLSGNVGPRKKLRPMSAGRIQDDPSISLRYARLSSIHSAEQSRQSSCKEFTRTATGISASAESLLDQSESARFFRARSTSTPHTFKIHTHKPSSACNVQNSSPQKKPEGETRASKGQTSSVSEYQRTRVVAPRGKSMEELGVFPVSRTLALSMSSEQLDHLGTNRVVARAREKRCVSFFWEGEEKAQMRSQKRPFFKQDSAPELCSGEDFLELGRNPERSDLKAPKSVVPSTFRGRALSANSRSSIIFTDTEEHSFVYTGSPQTFLPNYQGLPERIPSRMNSASSPSSPSSRIKTAPAVHSLLLELSAKDQGEIPRLDSSQEVSLSRGVTTDPSSWVIKPDLDRKDEECLSPHTETSARSAPDLLMEPKAGGQAETTRSAVLDPGTSQPAEGAQQGEEEKGSSLSETKAPESATVKVKANWEELVEEVVAEDRSLARALFPVTNRKTAVMLMEQLLSEDTLLMEEHYRKKRAPQTEESSGIAEAENVSPLNGEISEPNLPTRVDGQAQENKDSDVTEKKKLLIALVERHLQALGRQRATLKEELQENSSRGVVIDALVQQSCPTAEHDRYALFIGDLERVVSLLLCLSARLARVQNALSAAGDDTDAEEKQSLDNRHRLLCKQREDAKDLKDNLDRRERIMSAVLAKNLTAEQLQDYRRFVQTKAALLIQQKDLEERQHLGEEQLESLLSSIQR